MSADDRGISRRTVLKATGTAAVAAGAGLADATGRVRVNVGYAGASGRRAALDAADEVVREFDFGALTVRVPERAISGLRNRPDVRYVEPVGVVRADDRR